jgi:type VI secretion system secreted protein VgrG
MNPKSGKAGSPVSPIDPVKAEAADVADPGEVEKVKAEQRKTQSGKYGSVPVKAAKAPQTAAEKEAKKSWIEILAVDDKDRPFAGERYKIVLPDGSVAEGTLDEKGLARIDGIEPGSCTVTFPDVDKSICKKA